MKLSGQRRSKYDEINAPYNIVRQVTEIPK